MKEVLQSIIKDEARMITERIERKYLSDNLGRKIGTAGAGRILKCVSQFSKSENGN